MDVAPTIVANSRKHHQVGAVFVLNLFLGWTLVGWVVALAMACSATSTPPAPSAPVRLPTVGDRVSHQTYGIGTVRRLERGGNIAVDFGAIGTKVINAGFVTVMPAVAPEEGTKKCPRCAETIKAAAKVCRFCSYEFTPAS